MIILMVKNFKKSMEAGLLSNKIRRLNGSQLKWIAMGSMLMDHFNKGILYNLIIIKDISDAWLIFMSDVFDVLGRIAFPIFMFLLVEGFFHTRSKMKYFSNLMFFGILSEIPYDMFESGQYVDWGGQNIVFTFALALLTIVAIDETRKRIPKLWIVCMIGITLVSCWISAHLGLDYTYYGILIPIIFYVLNECWIASVLGYIVVLKEVWSFVGFVLINLYNGKRGKMNKWIGYWFYPIHLFLIGIIRMFILKV